MNQKQKMTSSRILAFLLIQVALSSSGVANCISNLPNYYDCYQSCWNTGGVCDSSGNCTCAGTTTSKDGMGCWCTSPLTCTSGGCFTGCNGAMSDGTKYYGTPPLTPNRCIACIAPQVCSNYAVTSCSNGAPIYQKEFCCSTNCAVCNQTTCTQCVSPSAQYIIGLSCTACASYQVCSNSQITGCTGAYYFASSTCNACGLNCASCTASNCLACTSSTGFYISGQSCTVCSSPYSCTGSAISGCVSAYYYTAPSTCTACQLNCQICTSTICTQCTNGNNYFINGNQCQNCDQNRTCSSSTIIGCSPSTSYYLSSTIPLTCITCSSPLTCINSQINGCISGYYLSGQTCLGCSSNCDSCNSTSCITCITGYYLNASTCSQCPAQCSSCTNSTCTACVSPCATCNFSSCLSCVNTNQYLSSNTTCSTCPSHCLTCNSTTCQSCVSPCLICSLSACLTCISSNYYTTGTTCTQCTAPCSTCNSTTCLTCPLTNQYVNGISCSTCPSHCLTCTQTDCQTCSSPCQTCSRTACLTCIAQNYYITGTTCAQCDTSCSTCTSTNCLTCPNSNQYTSLNVCLTCPTQCLTCNSTSCQTCLSPCLTCNMTSCLTCIDNTYYPTGISCVSCPTQCLTCTQNACQSCLTPCQTCNHTQCLTCVYTNQYTSGITCLTCPSHCLTCDQSTCFTCQSPCSTCNRTSCLSCIGANYYVSGTTCTQCDSSCSTCNSMGCLTCPLSNQYTQGIQCLNCPQQCATCNQTQCQTCVAPCATCNRTQCLSCTMLDYYASGDQCLQCDQSCATCNNIACLTCPQSGQYINASGKCAQCPATCLTCNQFTCLSCHGNCLTCNFTQCTSCISGYLSNNDCVACDITCLTCNALGCLSCLAPLQLNNQQCKYPCDITCATCTQYECLTCFNQQAYISGQICQPCSNNCLTCSNQFKCLSCDSSLFRILQNNQCVCMDGYHLYKDSCVKIDCLSSLGKQHPACQYFDCSDGEWEYGEQCDDGNFMNRDGCSNCMIEQGYTCSNTILQISTCRRLPINCISGTISNDSVTCNLCRDGYYPILNQCLSCQPQCLTCNDHKQCINCRFPQMSLDNECNLCESQPGQYSNYLNNQCETLCGDGITAGSEQCDIGNQNNLGCTRCQLNPGFYCNTNECFKIEYPTPVLTQIEQGQSLYKNNRQFKLEYNTPIQIQDIKLFSQIIIYNLDNSIDYTYQWIQKSQQQFILNMTLNTQCIGNQLKLNFVNITKILSDSNYCQQIQSLKVNISDYLQVSTATIQASQGLGTSTEYLLIILGVFVGLSILFGGLETFWNLLDLLQIMSYLQYINTIYPYNLQTFLNLFSFVQLSNLPINQYLNLKYYLQDYIIFDNFQQPPQLIQNDGFTTITILNIVPISMAWFYAILIYQGAKFMFRVLQVSNIRLTEKDTAVTIKLKIWLLMIKSMILSICQTINSEFIYSGIIRTFQSSAYDISFVIVLGIYALDINSNDQFVQLNSLLTAFLAFTYFISVYMIFRLAGFNKSTLVLHKLQYGAIFESAKLDKFSVYLNSLALVKKFLFMVVLILFYNEPLCQAASIILISICQVLYFVNMNPFEDIQEKVKQVSCEAFLVLTELMFALLVVDDYLDYFSYTSRDIIGWCCISGLITIILTQVAVDIRQQFKMLKRIYNKFRIFVDSITNQPNNKKQPIFI